ncbi:uncharacterized protein LOC122086662 isoform X4 [Macadamia integrifolia]|uniref:uncharacterized protein LOC122086662 isoform X4 n=1 Tax=Macadamia integrifolia TaxID=60698 RepID=UPI001C4EBA14|nr:uncharacterized protein LOC122086662 isoform X4 [Macadamia integrifolia]
MLFQMNRVEWERENLGVYREEKGEGVAFLQFQWLLSRVVSLSFSFIFKVFLFYIMRLETRSLTFNAITYHSKVTQCLGNVGGHVWYLGIAKGSIVDPKETVPHPDQEVMQSECGHYYVPPHPDDVCVFRISGPKFLKLNIGTWHAGPLFKADAMEFYNLELSNTNVVDHTTHYFKDGTGTVFAIDD